MITKKQLAATLGDETRVQIIQLLSKKELTLTQVFKALPGIKRRESAYKSLQKLVSAGLVKKRFNQKKQAHFYSVWFRKIEINQELELIVK